jgi:hypothetical protein
VPFEGAVIGKEGSLILAQLSNDKLVGLVILSLAGVVVLVGGIGFIRMVVHEFKDAKVREGWCAQGVDFERLPAELKPLVQIAMEDADVMYPKDAKSVVFVDMSKIRQKLVCEVCHHYITGRAILYKRYSGDFDRVCMDRAECNTRAKAIQKAHLAASKDAHAEAIEYFDEYKKRLQEVSDAAMEEDQSSGKVEEGSEETAGAAVGEGVSDPDQKEVNKEAGATETREEEA